MPERATAKAKGKKGGSVFQKKIAGAPVWVWGGGLLAAVLVGLYFRRKRQQSGTSSATAQPATDTGGASGTTGTTGTAAGTGSADLGDLGLQNNIDAAKAQVQDFTDWLAASQGQLGAGATPPSTTATSNIPGQDTTPAHPGQGTVGVISRAHKAVAVPKASPNTSAGRSHKAQPVTRKPSHPVTHHATHAAPQRHRAKVAPKRRRRRSGGKVGKTV